MRRPPAPFTPVTQPRFPRTRAALARPLRVLLAAAGLALVVPLESRATPPATPRPFSLPQVEAPSRSDSAPRPISPRPERPAQKIGSGAARAPRSSSTPSWSGSVSALLIVIAIIVIGARLLRSRLPQAIRALPQAAVQVLGRRMVDGRHAIQLVRVGSRLLVVGSSAHGLTTLSEITDPVEVDFLAGLCQSSATPPGDGAFSSWLNRLTRTDAPLSPDPTSFPTADPSVPDTADEQPAHHPELAPQLDLATSRLRNRLSQSLTAASRPALHRETDHV